MIFDEVQTFKWKKRVAVEYFAMFRARVPKTKLYTLELAKVESWLIYFSHPSISPYCLLKVSYTLAQIRMFLDSKLRHFINKMHLVVEYNRVERSFRKLFKLLLKIMH